MYRNTQLVIVRLKLSVRGGGQGSICLGMMYINGITGISPIRALQSRVPFRPSFKDAWRASANAVMASRFLALMNLDRYLYILVGYSTWKMEGVSVRRMKGIEPAMIYLMC